MTTLKEFEEALREQGLNMALAVLERLRERDRAKRTIAPARRVAGRKMTPELARAILDLHGSTNMTQQEVAFQLGVNQGRVNEVIKRGKWLSDDPAAPEAVARDRALARAAEGVGTGPRQPKRRSEGRRDKAAKGGSERKRPRKRPVDQPQLALGDL